MKLTLPPGGSAAGSGRGGLETLSWHRPLPNALPPRVSPRPALLGEVERALKASFG
ncbi:hypothetical protein Rcae01_05944 [Novipirellula caenicola]|uniref:Uncharacterized protein n=1 Tax=Novipirellula caenicola TaxID=1536901 RepID=A0ABP9VZ86_9BACT